MSTVLRVMLSCVSHLLYNQSCNTPAPIHSGALGVLINGRAAAGMDKPSLKNLDGTTMRCSPVSQAIGSQEQNRRSPSSLSQYVCRFGFGGVIVKINQQLPSHQRLQQQLCIQLNVTANFRQSSTFSCDQPSSATAPTNSALSFLKLDACAQPSIVF